MPPICETAAAILTRATITDSLMGGPAPFSIRYADGDIMDGDKLERQLSLERVADVTSYSVYALRDFIKSGELIAVRWGRAYRVPESEVVRFMEARARAEIPAPQRPGSKPRTRTTDENGGT